VIIWSFVIVLVATLGTYAVGVGRANRLRASGGISLNSLPSYHGLLSASLVFLFGFFASIGSTAIIVLPFWFSPVAATLTSAAAGFYALSRINPEFRARRSFESIVLALLLACSVVAVLTTVGIFASVAFESFSFFREINPFEFLLGTKWTPTGSPPSFGFIPLLAGTLLITIIAIGVATPLGLLSAIYMAEYASPKLRQTLKPLLEMLAGIPTVVLGFFAALTVAPLIRNTGESFGLVVASESALAAGLVMGMMIVPLISSLSDDIINSVPQSLRDGSYAMGATHSETIKRVVLPAALPGIVSAIMLAISRAVGETMIVVMAAGLAANLSLNPLAAVSTITVQIATLLVGDQEFDSAKTLSAFALGIVLFFFTLGLNYVALRFVKKYRQAYD
jgi:phosphate transport system permease protein